MSENQTKWEFSGNDQLTRLLEEINARFEKLDSTVSEVEANIDKALGGAKSHVFVFNEIADAAGRVMDVIQQGIAPFAEYDDKIKDLQAITGIAGQDLERLGDSARQNGIDFNIGASQGVEAYKLLASNIDVVTTGGIEALESLGKETILLAKAGRVTLPEAAQTAASALNQYKLSAEEASRVTNAMAAGAKYGAAEIPDLAMSLKESGATAANAGLSIEQTIGPLEIMSQQMLKGSEAGTALRNIIIRLQTELGVDLSKKGLPQALKELQPRLKDTTFLAKAFGAENLNAAQILISNADAVANMTTKVTGTQIAYEQAGINMSTFNEKTASVSARIDELLIRLGTAIEPVLTAIINGVNAALDWLLANGPLVVDILTSIAWGVGVAATVWAVLNAQMIIANAWIWLTTAAQWALNVAMSANPIGIIVVAIGALVAGLVLAYKRSVTFRAVLAGIGAVAKTLLTIFMGMGKVLIGIYTFDFGLIKEGIADTTGAVKDIASKGIGGIFREGYNALMDEEKAKEEAERVKKEQEKNKQLSTGNVNFNGSGGGAGGSPTGGGPSVIGGGGGGRNVSINIREWKVNITVQTNQLPGSIAKIKDQILEDLVAVVRDGEIAIANQ